MTLEKIKIAEGRVANYQSLKRAFSAREGKEWKCLIDGRKEK